MDPISQSAPQDIKRGRDVYPADEELIRRLRRRDESALGTVMRKYSSQLLSVANRVLRRPLDAEEVTQDVFWALWRSPERFDSTRGPLLTWLVILARSRAIDRLRRIQASGPHEIRLTRQMLSTTRAASESFRADRELIIRELLHRLTPEQGRVVQKAYFEGYALAEIAKLQRTPLGTIKGRARFALKRLRSEIDAWPSHHSPV